MTDAVATESRILRSSERDTRWGGLPFSHVRCPDVCTKDEVEYADYGLTLVVRGKNETEISYSKSSRRLLHFVPGAFCAYPPGRHWNKLTGTGSMDLINITLSDAWLEQNGLLRVRRPELGAVIPCAHDRTVQFLGLEMLKELQNGCRSGVLYAQGIGLALLGRIDSLAGGRRVAGSLPTPVRKLAGPVARRVADFIETHLDGALTVGAIARVAAMGESNFTLCFRNTFGAPVHRYVTTRRIDKAAVLLKNTYLSVPEIATACGYSSQSYFTTAFHAATGETPARFRGRAVAD